MCQSRGAEPTWNVYSRVGLEVTTSHISIERDCPITLDPVLNNLRASKVLHTVTQDVGVARLPVSGSELHDRDEPGQVVHFDLWVVSVDQS